MNFIQIERHKANADARSQFCHFVFQVDNFSKYQTKLNHSLLKSFADCHNFTEIRKIKLKKRITVSVCFKSNEDHETLSTTY